MTKPKPPLRKVVRSTAGPRSQRLTMPNGDVAIVCGPPMLTDDLECGHTVRTYGRRAKQRRCPQSAAGPQQLLDFDPVPRAVCGAAQDLFPAPGRPASPGAAE